MTKAKQPEDRIGVYKTLKDVPERYRLKQFSDLYRGRDVWQDFCSWLFERYNSNRFQEDVHRAGRRWKNHVQSCGRHHALATPQDIEEWSQFLVDEYKVKTAYNSYWVRVERFYSWLQWHTDHPHVYHPPRMAAANYEASSTIWQEKIQRGRQ